MDEIPEEDFDNYFNFEGLAFSKYASLYGMMINHGASFVHQSPEEAVADMEERLNASYPRDYINIITEDGVWASAHFRSGWWKVKNTETEMVLWSSSLCLQADNISATEDEQTLPIHGYLKTGGYDHIPFGNGFRINKELRSENGHMTTENGHLYFDRTDGAPHFVDLAFRSKSRLGSDFSSMMNTAKFVAYDN